MRLPVPPPAYSAEDQAQTRRAIETESDKYIQRGQILREFKMLDTVTGHTVTVTIASGAFVIT